MHGPATLQRQFQYDARQGLRRGSWVRSVAALPINAEAYMPILEALSRMYRGAAGEDLIDFLARCVPTWLVQMPWLLSSNKLEGLQRAVLGATRDRMLREMVESVEI